MTKTKILSSNDDYHKTIQPQKKQKFHSSFDLIKKRQEMSLLLKSILNKIEHVADLDDQNDPDDYEHYDDYEQYLLIEKRKARLIEFQTEHTLAYHGKLKFFI